MAEMTPKQKLDATVRFAEALEWKLNPKNTTNPWKVGTFSKTIGNVWVRRSESAGAEHFDPWTSLPDAKELADKLDIRFTRDPDRGFETDDGTILIYSAWSPNDDHSKHAGDLCEAICVVADLMISEMGENDA